MPCTTSSILPQQTAQILCYIHQLLVAQIINKVQMFSINTGYGLYITKETGHCILFQMTLSKKKGPLKIYSGGSVGWY